MWLLRGLTVYCVVNSRSAVSPNSSTSGPSVTSMTGLVVKTGLVRPSRNSGRPKYGWRDGRGGLPRFQAEALHELQPEAHHSVRGAAAQQAGDREGSVDGDVGAQPVRIPRTATVSPARTDTGSHCGHSRPPTVRSRGAPVTAMSRSVVARIRKSSAVISSRGSLSSLPARMLAALAEYWSRAPLTGRPKAGPFVPAEVGDHGVAGLQDDQ